jgi:hypothetical protein
MLERDHVELGVLDERVPLGSHIALMWETEEQFAQGVMFLEAGIRAGDHCVIFGFEEACSRVCDVLAAEGFDLDDLRSRGRVTIVNGRETGDEILEELGSVFQRAVNAGARVIRLLGNIGWGRPGWPPEEEILAFEARVTGAAAAFPSVVVCMYDVGTLSGRVILNGAFRTHPLTIAGNIVRENPYYEPVDENAPRVHVRHPRPERADR